MKFKDLKKSLETNIGCCYLLTSKEDKEDLFLKSSCKNNIIKATIKDFIDLNLTVFSNGNLDNENFKKALNTMPFMQEKKVVLLKEESNKKNDELNKIIEEYLVTPNNFTVLIIDACENTSLKNLENNNNVTVVDCSRIDRDLIKAFVLKSCKENDVNINSDALDKLIDYCDSYMIKINLELNKLINYKKDEKIILVEDVITNVNKSEEYQIYELTNALFLKQGDKALFIVEDIIKNKKNISAILTLIYNHIRRLFYVKTCKDSLSNIAKMLDIKEFAAKKISEQAENISAKKLKEILTLCKDTDFKIKSGGLDIISGIYNLIFTILI